MESSDIRGNFRILADGSRVIDWGSGKPQLIFTEVDVEKNDLLDFYFTSTATCPTASSRCRCRPSTSGSCGRRRKLGMSQPKLPVGREDVDRVG